MMLPHHIAIDGPAASGKTTLGRRLGLALGCVFLDAGLLYRTITWEALQAGISLDDVNALAAIAAQLHVRVTPEYIRINHKAPRRDLGEPNIDVAVPFVAQHPEVREHVRCIQQHIAMREPVVFSGRDIGTVVLPEIELKFFLDVELEERVERQFRRHNGLLDREFLASIIEWRDTLDRERQHSPLKPAPDALCINATYFSAEDTFNVAWQHIERFMVLG